MQFILNRLNVDIKPGESLNVSRLFLQSFLTGLATSFYFVSTSSFFIEKLSFSQLPLGYIISGAVGLMIVGLYKQSLNRYGLVTGTIVSSTLYILICILLFTARVNGYHQDIIKLAAFAGFVCILPFSSLFALTFSTMTLKIFNLGQSKRLLAFVGMGEVIASILAYLTVPLLTKLFGNSAYFLLITALAIFLSIFPLLRLSKNNMEKTQEVIQPKTVQRISFSILWKDHYFKMIGICTFFSIIAVFLADYSYLLSVKSIVKEYSIPTAALVSVIFTVIKVGELLFSFLSSRFLNILGMQYSLLILPILIMVSSFLGFASGTLFHHISIFVIAFLLLNKWFERVIRKGITNPSLKILFQVTHPEDRAKIQTLIDGSFSQLSSIIAGGILWLMANYLTDGTELYPILYASTIVCFLFYLGWLIFSNQLYSLYKDKIQEFLKSNQSNSESPRLNHDYVQNWLNAGYTKVVDDNSLLPLLDGVKRIHEQPHELLKEFFTRRIKEYNPTMFTNSEPYSNEQFFTICSSLLFSNEDALSRMSIIEYSRFLSAEQKIELLLNSFDVLQHDLQYRLLINMNMVTVQCEPNQRFYFTEICAVCISEILWIESTLLDIEPLKNSDLEQGLTELKEERIRLLFQLFKLLFNPQSIGIIEEIWIKRNLSEDNEGFIVELLENILDGEMKKITVPLFMDLPLSAKVEKLGENFYADRMELSLRLKDIVMKNFNLVDPYIKELASIAYVSITGETDFMNVHKGSRFSRLAVLTNQTQEKEIITYQLKYDMVVRRLQLPERFYQSILLDRLLKWGIYSDRTLQRNLLSASYVLNENEKHSSTFSFLDNGVNYRIDVYGLYLLLNYLNHAAEF